MLPGAGGLDRWHVTLTVKVGATTGRRRSSESGCTSPVPGTVTHAVTERGEPGHRAPAGAAQPAVTMKPQVLIASILLTQVVAVPILNGNQGKEAKPEEDVKLHGISSKQATAKDHSAHYKIAAGVVKQQVQLLVNLSDPFFENEQYHDEDIEEERINFRSSCIFRVQILKKTQLSR